ncbi:phage tail assembly chaperone [Corticibacterium sp. UT-5YL-CI-8]|nr:phage tail assembly chaperone [Tianweitania sp. UT-5YL-CI-8]
MSAAAPAPAAFPWERVMAVGLGLLRLSPQAFWSMTPREFERAASILAPAQTHGPSRQALDALMLNYPDRQGDQHG